MLKRRVSETTLDRYAPRMRPADLVKSVLEVQGKAGATDSQQPETKQLPLSLSR